MALHRDAWPSWPTRLRIDGHRVTLGWFTHIDPSAITISGVGHDPLRLRVFASDTPSYIAAAAMRGESLDAVPGPQPPLERKPRHLRAV